MYFARVSGSKILHGLADHIVNVDLAGVGELGRQMFDQLFAHSPKADEAYASELRQVSKMISIRAQCIVGSAYDIFFINHLQPREELLQP